MYGPLFYVHSVGWFTTSISKLDWVIGALIKLLLIRSLEHRMVVVLHHKCFTYWQRKAAAAQRQPIKQQQPAVSNKEPPTAVTRSGPQATQPRQSQEQTTQVRDPVSVRAKNTNQEEMVVPTVKLLLIVGACHSTWTFRLMTQSYSVLKICPESSTPWVTNLLCASL